MTLQDSSEDMLRLIVETLSDGVVLQDSNSKIIEFNSAALSILEVTEDQLLGRTSMSPQWKAIREDRTDFRGEDHPAVVALRTGEKVLGVIMGLELPSGGLRWIRINATPCGGRSDSLGQHEAPARSMVLCTFYDITEELKVKHALELERSKSVHNAKLASIGEMSAGIAHEINNPLAIISGSLDLLSIFKNDSIQFKSNVRLMQRSVDRIAKIVRGLGKFSRARDNSAHKAAALSDIVRECLVFTDSKAKRNSTRLDVYLDHKSLILCDEVEIEQVIINLINNAIDAVKNLPEKWVKISLCDEGSQVVLQIRDSGPGISFAIEQKLFEPFFTTKPSGEGTGLGLSIVKGILDQHKANILINRNDKNTCFEVRFPKFEKPKV